MNKHICTVACRAFTRPRNKQIYQSLYWLMVANTRVSTATYQHVTTEKMLKTVFCTNRITGQVHVIKLIVKYLNSVDGTL
jgi:hypothetical protein